MGEAYPHKKSKDLTPDIRIKHALDLLMAENELCYRKLIDIDPYWAKYSTYIAKNNWDALLKWSKVFQQYAYEVVFFKRQGCKYNHPKCVTFSVLDRSYDPIKDDPNCEITEVTVVQYANDLMKHKMFRSGWKKDLYRLLHEETDWERFDVNTREEEVLRILEDDSLWAKPEIVYLDLYREGEKYDK